MKTYYELHVTIEEPIEKKDKVKSLIEAYTHRTWRFSAIEDDIVLGKGIKMYATHHLKDEPLAADTGELACAYLARYLIENKINVVRMKVEHVVFDHIKGRDADYVWA